VAALNTSLMRRCATHQGLLSLDLEEKPLKFDMSGGPKGAKRPLVRPLGGGVRRRHRIAERWRRPPPWPRKPWVRQCPEV